MNLRPGAGAGAGGDKTGVGSADTAEQFGAGCIPATVWSLLSRPITQGSRGNGVKSM